MKQLRSQAVDQFVVDVVVCFDAGRGSLFSRFDAGQQLGVLLLVTHIDRGPDVAVADLLDEADESGDRSRVARLDGEAEAASLREVAPVPEAADHRGPRLLEREMRRLLGVNVRQLGPQECGGLECDVNLPNGEFSDIVERREVVQAGPWDVSREVLEPADGLLEPLLFFAAEAVELKAGRHSGTRLDGAHRLHFDRLKSQFLELFDRPVKAPTREIRVHSDDGSVEAAGCQFAGPGEATERG